MSYVLNRARDRTYDDTDATGAPVINAFSGNSRTWVADAIYKWSPGGNATRTNLKLQGEYFRRTERGTLILFDINGWEFILLLVVALLVIGPERLPEYSAKLAKLVKQVRGLADTAKVQLREQMGPEFDDIDWRQYDPRQYDPRRIVREALLDPSPMEPEAGAATYAAGAGHDAAKPTPYDDDAT